MRRLALVTALLAVALTTGTATGSVDRTPRSVIERALLEVKPAPPTFRDSGRAETASGSS